MQLLYSWYNKGMKITQTERAYLAGLWDGEGSITLWRHKRKETGTWRLIASLVLTNTDLKIIEAAEELLTKAGATFHRNHIINGRDQWKNSYQLTSRNRESVKRALRAMLPFLRGKKEQAQIVLAFVRSRDEQMRKSKGHPSNTSKYSLNEFALERRIRPLNAKGKSKSPETICQTA